MLGRLVRILLALTAIAPLSVSLAYVFASQRNFVWAAVAASCCIGLGLIALWIIRRASERLEHLPIVIQKAKSADKEVIGFFAAYALPLVFRGQAAPDLAGWLVAAAMLLFVLWSTHAIQVSFGRRRGRTPNLWKLQPSLGAPRWRHQGGAVGSPAYRTTAPLSGEMPNSTPKGTFDLGHG